MERFKLAVSTGEPVNPPIWWIAPNDKIAQTVDDEFMLGDKILVAPVIVEGKNCMKKIDVFFKKYENSILRVNL